MDGGSYVYPISSSSSEYFQGMFTALFLLLPERTRPDEMCTICPVRHHQGLQVLKAILDYFSMKLSVEIKKPK